MNKLLKHANTGSHSLSLVDAILEFEDACNNKPGSLKIRRAAASRIEQLLALDAPKATPPRNAIHQTLRGKPKATTIEDEDD